MKLYRVLVVTTPQRLANLFPGTEERTKRAFWFATLEEIRQHGVLASIWRRAGSKETQAFLASMSLVMPCLVAAGDADRKRSQSREKPKSPTSYAALRCSWGRKTVASTVRKAARTPPDEGLSTWRDVSPVAAVPHQVANLKGRE